VVKSTSENALPNSNEKKSSHAKKRRNRKVGAQKRARVRSAKGSTRVSALCGAVFLVGFMGAGKSSVGRALGQRLNWLFEDLDDRIERREGRRIAEIFRDSGEPAFRRAERLALEQALEQLRGGISKIIALGGGAYAQREVTEMIEASGVPTVFLDAPVEELWQRCCKQAAQTQAERPLLKNIEQFRQLYDSRRQSYRKASLKIQTGSRTVDAIAAEIAEKLGLESISLRTESGEAE
jgi:shikimate kinase